VFSAINVMGLGMLLLNADDADARQRRLFMIKRVTSLFPGFFKVIQYLPSPNATDNTTSYGWHINPQINPIKIIKEETFLFFTCMRRLFFLNSCKIEAFKKLK
jgi:hypothetical protein